MRERSKSYEHLENVILIKRQPTSTLDLNHPALCQTDSAHVASYELSLDVVLASIRKSEEI